jgi:hypothetical protein
VAPETYAREYLGLDALWIPDLPRPDDSGGYRQARHFRLGAARRSAEVVGTLAAKAAARRRTNRRARIRSSKGPALDRRPDLVDMPVIMRNQVEVRCASITGMIRYYAEPEGRVIFDHRPN